MAFRCSSSIIPQRASLTKGLASLVQKYEAASYTVGADKIGEFEKILDEASIYLPSSSSTSGESTYNEGVLDVTSDNESVQSPTETQRQMQSLKKLQNTEIEKLTPDEFNLNLMIAIQNKDILYTNVLLRFKDKIDPNLKFPQFANRTCLHSAVINNLLAVVEQLLSLGFSVNELDKFQRTPIHIASCFGYREILLNLLTYGGKCNVRDLYGYSPLHLAMARGHHDIVQDLLMFEADINFKRESGNTCVHDIMILNNVKGLKFFLALQQEKGENGLKILFNTKDQLGNTPLFRAIMSNSLECVKVFLEEAAKPTAAKCGFHVNINVKNDKGNNCFHLVSSNGNPEFISLLFGYNPELCKTLLRDKNSRGENPLHIAAKLGKWKVVEKLLELFNNHQNINSNNNISINDFIGLNDQDNSGNTPLHLAIIERKTKTFKILIAEPKCRQDISNFQLVTAAGLLRDLEKKHYDREFSLKEFNEMNKGHFEDTEDHSEISLKDFNDMNKIEVAPPEEVQLRDLSKGNKKSSGVGRQQKSGEFVYLKEFKDVSEQPKRNSINADVNGNSLVRPRRRRNSAKESAAWFLSLVSGTQKNTIDQEQSGPVKDEIITLKDFNEGNKNSPDNRNEEEKITLRDLNKMVGDNDSKTKTTQRRQPRESPRESFSLKEFNEMNKEYKK